MPSLLEAGRNIAANWLSGSHPSSNAQRDPLIILKALQDPATRQRVYEFLEKNPQLVDELLKMFRQPSEQLIAQTIGGYATLPVLLALLSAIFTDKPIVPLLLGLAGLGIAHFFPEVRESVNFINWLSASADKQPPAGSAPKEKPPEEPPSGPKPLIESTPPSKLPEEPPSGTGLPDEIYSLGF